MSAFQFLQVTDPHLFGDATHEFYGLNTAELLAVIDRHPQARR